MELRGHSKCWEESKYNSIVSPESENNNLGILALSFPSYVT